MKNEEMSVNSSECRRTVWVDWAERKKTNKPKLLGEIRKNCPFCAHCTWIVVDKTNEFYCHRVNNNGLRAVVDVTGNVPEECEHFNVRSKYAANEF